MLILISFSEAAQEYVLATAQDTGAGGLRDKPGKRTDIYHTFYALSGLSTAQHRVYQSPKKLDKLLQQWKDSPGFVSPVIGEASTSETAEEKMQRRKLIWARSRAWKEDESASKYVGGSKNRLVRLVTILRIHTLTVTIPECDSPSFYPSYQPMRYNARLLLRSDG